MEVMLLIQNRTCFQPAFVHRASMRVSLAWLKILLRPAVFAKNKKKKKAARQQKSGNTQFWPLVKYSL